MILLTTRGTKQINRVTGKNFSKICRNEKNFKPFFSTSTKQLGEKKLSRSISHNITSALTYYHLCLNFFSLGGTISRTLGISLLTRINVNQGF